MSAFDASGSLCAFSSRGPEVDVTALGCGMDVAALPDGAPGIGQSTSLASAYVGGVLTALRSHRPDLTVEQTEALLRANAAPAPGGPALDAAATFRAAGLAALVDAYRPPAPAATPRRARCDRHRRVCTTPRLKSVRRHGRRVLIRLRAFPSHLRAVVQVNGRRVLRTRVEDHPLDDPPLEDRDHPLQRPRAASLGRAADQTSGGPMKRSALIVVLAVLSLAGSAARAAGTYEVLSCGAASGVNHAWQSFNEDTASLVTGASCVSLSGGAEDGLFAVDRIPGPPTRRGARGRGGSARPRTRGSPG